MIGVFAVVSFLVVWQRHHDVSTYVDDDGTYLRPWRDRDVYLSPAFIAIAWVIALVAARVLAARSRRDLARWSVAAKLFAAVVIITWISIRIFDDQWIKLAAFRYRADWAPPTTGLPGLELAIQRVMYPPHVGVELSPLQIDAFVAGLVMLVFTASVAIACLRERERPARSLKALENSAVIPLAVAFSMGALLYATMSDHREVTACRAAFATVAGIVAYASMLLRRRRREALS